jgi:hypothetical protein
MDLVLKVAKQRFLRGRDAFLGEILVAGEDDLDAPDILHRQRPAAWH